MIRIQNCIGCIARIGCDTGGSVRYGLVAPGESIGGFLPAFDDVQDVVDADDVEGFADFVPVVEFTDDGAVFVELLDYLPFPGFVDDFCGVFPDVLANHFLHVLVVHEHGEFEGLVLDVIKVFVPFCFIINDFSIVDRMVEDVVGFDVGVNEGLLFLSELGILLVVPFLGESVKEWAFFCFGLLAEAGEFFVQDVDCRRQVTWRNSRRFCPNRDVLSVPWTKGQ